MEMTLVFVDFNVVGLVCDLVVGLYDFTGIGICDEGRTIVLNGFACTVIFFGRLLVSVLFNRCGAPVGTGGGGLSGVTVPCCGISVAALMLVWYAARNGELCNVVD
jgi:hypothetical protein